MKCKCSTCIKVFYDPAHGAPGLPPPGPQARTSTAAARVSSSARPRGQAAMAAMERRRSAAASARSWRPVRKSPAAAPGTSSAVALQQACNTAATSQRSCSSASCLHCCNKPALGWSEPALHRGWTAAASLALLQLCLHHNQRALCCNQPVPLPQACATSQAQRGSPASRAEKDIPDCKALPQNEPRYTQHWIQGWSQRQLEGLFSRL